MFPGLIKYIMVLVFVDASAMFLSNYLLPQEFLSEEYRTVEKIVVSMFPGLYFGGMWWLVLYRKPIVKILLYIVLVLELVSLITVDIVLYDFDATSYISLVSIASIIGCIYIMRSEEGKMWFVERKES